MISAVLAAVLVVAGAAPAVAAPAVDSGAAGSWTAGTSATDSGGPTADAATAAAQDDGRTGNESRTGNATATVTFENQSSNGTVVVIESVTLPEGGFVAVHDAGFLAGDALNSTVGVSAYLEPGTHENVAVRLFEVSGVERDRLPGGNATLVAMAHLDTDGNRTFDFVTSGGTADGPYLVGGTPVTDVATVTVERAGAGPPGGNATAVAGRGEPE